MKDRAKISLKDLKNNLEADYCFELELNGNGLDNTSVTNIFKNRTTLLSLWNMFRKLKNVVVFLKINGIDV